MNVIHLVNDLKSNFYPEFFKNLDNKDIDHVVISSYTNLKYSDINEFQHFKCKIIHRYYFFKIFKIFNFFYLLKILYIKRKNKNIIHCHNTNLEGFFALIIFFIFKIKYVVTLRNTDINYTRTNFLTSFIYNLTLKYSSNIIVKTVPYSKFIPSKYTSKLVMIPNGLNNFWINNLNCVSSQKKVSEPFIIVIVADFYSNKNIDILIYAVKNLIINGFNIKLRIAGNKIGDSVEFYSSLIKKYNSFVEYVGILNNNSLLNFYRSADIFCMCSKNETFGLVYLEALSQGIPIVYTSNQGIDGWVNEEYGISIEPTVNNIENALSKIILNNWKFLPPDIIFFNRFKWQNISLEFEHIYSNNL